MEKFWTIFLTILVWTVSVALVFSIVVLIAGTINHVDFYEQLCLWFGHESGFAKIFIK